ncbi:hypothetical protein F1654_11990 [Alkalicaulis satelles]|uniref:Uncharacterized protein n=1 Tax=Alkalicaulis satelles TaxID=2609175 RepID=A0A5M6ZBT3_9PROT|nr:helix-hairpin-helix domain-containing protein [Alkalicaulis satelles]KAA5801610.1 hypothetical protein F1654_11990 [Alkalicaulis satelles]
MLWLIWEMWILLALFFAAGVIAGWVVRGRSDEAAAPAPRQLGFATRMDGRPDGDEPAAADAAPAAESEPAPDAAPAPRAAPDAQPASPEPAAAGSDDLTAIRGLGPKAAEKLAEAGVTRYAQIAAWSEADVARFDEVLNARGRIARDGWVDQAKALAG